MERLQTHTFGEREIYFSANKILRTIFVPLNLNKLGALNKRTDRQGKYFPQFIRNQKVWILIVRVPYYYSGQGLNLGKHLTKITTELHVI